MNALAASTRAELVRLTRWPATWVMISVWLTLNLMFAYVFNYVAYATGNGSAMSEGASADELLADIAPAAFATTSIQGTAMFGSAIMLILGGLAVGSGYGWGTWKTVFTTGPRRAAAFGGTVLALAVIVVATVMVTFVVDAATATLLAGIESQPITWPPLTENGQAFGAGVLILGSALGVLVGTLARSAALAVGLGLVWALAVENLLRGVADILGPLEYLTDVLPGTAAGSLVGALIGCTPGSDTPGVLATSDAAPASVLLAGYALVFAAIAIAIVRHRDAT